MTDDKILAFVLAGGQGTRLRPLTANCPKPALPFAGRRIIDFALSNLANSGIGAIYVLAQYKPQALIAHVQTCWAPILRRAGGFARVRLPQELDGTFLGTADAVYRSLDLVERHGPDLVAVFAADHVYRMDVRQMIAFHRKARADVTVAALPVPLRAARSFGAIASAVDGRVEGFEEKPLDPVPLPHRPTHAYASMGNYLFEPEALAQLLAAAHARGETDFGHHILPRAARTHRLYAYDFSANRVPGLLSCEEPCYWRDVGTLESYRAAQEDSLGPRPRFSVENEDWPVLGATTRKPAFGQRERGEVRARPSRTATGLQESGAALPP